MSNFKVPSREEVSPANQEIFDQLKQGIGFVPNLYAFYAHNETALGDYLAFQNRKTTLSKKEKEVVNLVVSQINGCSYCTSAHTAIGGMNGFSAEEIIELRKGSASFDSKLKALAEFVKSTTENRGKASEEAKANFFAAGYNTANLVDVVLNIGDKTVSNIIHNLADFEIDFPLAPALDDTVSA